MAADCGIELKKHNVAMISLYPGAVKTELVTELSNTVKNSEASKEKQMVIFIMAYKFVNKSHFFNQIILLLNLGFDHETNF